MQKSAKTFIQDKINRIAFHEESTKLCIIFAAIYLLLTETIV